MNPVLWQMIEHRFTKAHASSYLDGDLDRRGRERIERHTSVCPHCRALFASLRRMIDDLSGLAPARGATVADGVLERLRRHLTCARGSAAGARGAPLAPAHRRTARTHSDG